MLASIAIASVVVYDAIHLFYLKYDEINENIVIYGKTCNIKLQLTGEN